MPDRQRPEPRGVGRLIVRRNAAISPAPMATTGETRFSDIHQGALASSDLSLTAMLVVIAPSVTAPLAASETTTRLDVVRSSLARDNIPGTRGEIH